METTKEYVKLADDDLEAAVLLFNGRIYTICAQHCAQAIEKYLKHIYSNTEI